MQLTELEPWVVSGSPSIFTEMKDGEEWHVIDSGRAYHAGFSQTVHFDRPVSWVMLSTRASMYTVGRTMAIRIGIDVSGDFDPLSPNIFWAGWEGPDNGWSGEPKTLQGSFSWLGQTDKLVVFLEARANWPLKHTARFRDAWLQFEYADEPEPPEPEPEPPEPPPDLPDGDPRKWAIERMQQIQAQVVAMVETSVTLLEEVTQLALQLGLTPEEQARAQAWLDEYNKGKG